jgi:adenylate cyclase
MIFSLQRRFSLLLLLPVALVLLVTGGAGFFYASSYLLDQWRVSTMLKLEKAAHQISMGLNEKLDLINLVGKAQNTPNGIITQAFLIQQLLEKNGVRFVDVDEPEALNDPSNKSASNEAGYSIGATDGLYTMELCDDFGVCAPVMDPNALDRSLRIVKILRGDDEIPTRRLIVRIGFDSFLAPIKQMALWQGSAACLVTSTGQFLAATNKTFADRRRLGDNGSDVEKQVLREMRTKGFGSVFGKGTPPDVVVGFFKVPSINWYIVLFTKGSVIMEPMIRFRQYYQWATLGAILLILLLIRLTTRSVGRSIADISAAAARLQDGDYLVRLPEDRTDEIGMLNRNFNQMIQGLKQRDLIEQTFGRYVDKKVAAELMSRPESLRLGGEKRTVTIMMADLRNFTVVSEQLQPEDVIKMLNRHFSRMIAVIERYRGIIVDFYGDSILVFFNGVETDIAGRALDAVKCALEMQREFEEFVLENRAEGLPEIRMGIGVHTGDVVVGNIGTETRAKYGIVGSDVNLTDRIQSTATGGKVVISDRTYEAIWESLNVSREFNVCLKGVQDDKKLYEVESVEPSLADALPFPGDSGDSASAAGSSSAGLGTDSGSKT